MAVGENSLLFNVVPGVRLASAIAGIKSNQSHDLVLLEFAEGSVTAGVFTQSLFAAAPVVLGKQHLEQASPRYFLINSGNANAGVGDAGLMDAQQCCAALSQSGGVRPEEVIPFSTGVIGERLPVEKITDQLELLVAELAENKWLEAAQGIMTTDTRPKIATRLFVHNGETIVITGIAKGAGMIQPNMATMLSYVATNVSSDRPTLQANLKRSVDLSFNRITVDSDTSTNDSCMLTATCQTSSSLSDASLLAKFQTELDALMLELAHGIVRDAEGATKFIEVHVKGGQSMYDCSEIAYAIANSPLMKTAIFASDANWGRIVMAIGKADVKIDVRRLNVFLGDIQLMKNGEKDHAYTERAGAAVMAEEEIVITVDINAGDLETSVWTSDLSHEYVRINAEYRS
ncbi:MAG: glutamate N-acetyltransferase/amino-acid N-acetyltransferase [Sulfitobacter sp.]|jgi:glutamate N-acetyltransferase/amino-acid N-acetyltransferase